MSYPDHKYSPNMSPDSKPYPFDSTESFGQGSTPSPYNTTSPTNNNWMVLGFLLCLIFILMILLVILIAPLLYQWVRSIIPVDHRMIERRYETIEGWLISKRVRSHDQKCAGIVQSFTKQDVAKIAKVNSYDTTETADSTNADEEKECGICYDPFLPGEFVSWAPNLPDQDEYCNQHVFHHECIKEWLLRNANCPFCRKLYLPIDAPDFSMNKRALLDLSKQRRKRSDTTYFCVSDGLTTLQLPKKINVSTLQSIRELTEDQLDKAQQLVDLRGDRKGPVIKDDIEVDEDDDDDDDDDDDVELAGLGSEQFQRVNNTSDIFRRKACANEGDDDSNDSEHVVLGGQSEVPSLTRSIPISDENPFSS